MTRFPFVTFVLLLLVMVAADASALGRRRRWQPTAPLPAAADPSRTSVLQRLHSLRVEAAQKHYAYAKELYLGGIPRSDGLFNAQKLLLEASYDAVTTPEARLLALEQSVKLATADLEQVTGRIRFGGGSEWDRTGAVYALYTAEIRLEEERERQAGRTPSR
jgi:hypothetical protein